MAIDIERLRWIHGRISGLSWGGFWREAVDGFGALLDAYEAHTEALTAIAEYHIPETRNDYQAIARRALSSECPVCHKPRSEPSMFCSAVHPRGEEIGLPPPGQVPHIKQKRGAGLSKEWIDDA